MQKIKLITTDMILKRIFLSLIAMVCLQSASAQQLQASQSHFSTENGMSSNAIAGIYQDDYGFLWIATWNGLSRYDGYNFYNYRTGNGSRIKNLHNRIYDLAIDQSQNIWMRMYDYRVFVLNRSIDKIINPFEGINGYEKFKAYSPILVTSTGDVLVSIKDVGLYIIRLTRRGSAIVRHLFRLTPTGRKTKHGTESQSRNSVISFPHDASSIPNFDPISTIHPNCI